MSVCNTTTNKIIIHWELHFLSFFTLNIKFITGWRRGHRKKQEQSREERIKRGWVVNQPQREKGECVLHFLSVLLKKYFKEVSKARPCGTGINPTNTRTWSSRIASSRMAWATYFETCQKEKVKSPSDLSPCSNLLAITSTFPHSCEFCSITPFALGYFSLLSPTLFLVSWSLNVLQVGQTNLYIQS